MKDCIRTTSVGTWNEITDQLLKESELLGTAFLLSRKYIGDPTSFNLEQLETFFPEQLKELLRRGLVKIIDTEVPQVQV